MHQAYPDIPRLAGEGLGSVQGIGVGGQGGVPPFDLREHGVEGPKQVGDLRVAVRLRDPEPTAPRVPMKRSSVLSSR
jgi:hypothetical protein